MTVVDEGGSNGSFRRELQGLRAREHNEAKILKSPNHVRLSGFTLGWHGRYFFLDLSTDSRVRCPFLPETMRGLLLALPPGVEGTVHRVGRLHMKSLLSFVSFVLVGTGVWFAWPTGQVTGQPSRQLDAGVVPLAAAPAHADSRAVVSAPLTRQTEPIENALVYPDGKMLPALNGVTGQVRITWPPHREYTPLLGIETSADGEQWYHHEGDIWITTIKVEMNRQGKRSIEAVGKTVEKRPTVPLEQPESIGVPR